MKKNLQIVRDWYRAWVEQDASKLNLADDFRHVSPLGEYFSKDSFLEACWGKMGEFNMEMKGEVVDGDTVVVWYESIFPGGRMPICEWIKLENGLITEMRVFFNTQER